MSLVSVIIPTYNRCHWLGEAVDSVLAQTYKKWELIIVDDGSTEDILDFISSRYSGIEINVIRNEVATSPGFARNRGVEHATGDFVSFLDSDDLWYPDKLEKQIAVFKSEDDKLGFVGGGCDYIDVDGNPVMKPTYPPESAAYEDFILKIKMPGSGSNNLIRKNAFVSVGGFREDLQRAEDKQLWLKLLIHYRVAYVPEVVVTIRLHGTVRINVNEFITLRNRLSVDSEIEQPTLRKKAMAYSYFVVFKRQWLWNKLSALGMLFKSIWIYPFPISKEISRVKETISLFQDSFLRK